MVQFNFMADNNPNFPLKSKFTTSSALKYTSSFSSKKTRTKHVHHIKLNRPISEILHIANYDSLHDYLVLETGAKISIIKNMHYFHQPKDVNVVLYN